MERKPDMSIRLKRFSYRYAEEIFNSKLNIKNEIEDIIYDSTKDLSILTRPEFNKILEKHNNIFGNLDLIRAHIIHRYIN